MANGEHDREIDVARREAEVGRRELALDERMEAAHAILMAADLRDADADTRDDVSLKRDRAVDLLAFINPDGRQPYGENGSARRHAALDRGLAKDDRHNSADDRSKLTEDLGELDRP